MQSMLMPTTDTAHLIAPACSTTYGITGWQGYLAWSAGAAAAGLSLGSEQGQSGAGVGTVRPFAAVQVGAVPVAAAHAAKQATKSTVSRKDALNFGTLRGAPPG